MVEKSESDLYDEKWHRYRTCARHTSFFDTISNKNQTSCTKHPTKVLTPEDCNSCNTYLDMIGVNEEDYAREKHASCSLHIIIPTNPPKFSCTIHSDRATTWKDCIGCTDYRRDTNEQY